MTGFTAPAFGRDVTDEELATFHGGVCTVTITRDSNGNVTRVQTTGDCSNVQVVVN